MKKTPVIITLILFIAVSAVLSACSTDAVSSEVKTQLTDPLTGTVYNVGIGETETVFKPDGGGDGYTVDYKALDPAFAATGIRFIDANLDGVSDIQIPYIADSGAYKRHTWINNGSAFVYNTVLSSILDPVFEDGMVYSDANYGFAGIFRSEYEWKGVTLELIREYLLNAEEIAADVAADLLGEDETRVFTKLENDENGNIKDGRLNVAGIECDVYSVEDGGAKVALLAVDDNGQWYSDKSVSGIFFALAYMQDTGYFENNVAFINDASKLLSLTPDDVSGADERGKNTFADGIICLWRQSGETLSEAVTTEAVLTALKEAAEPSIATVDAPSVFENVCEKFGIDAAKYIEG